MRRYWPWLMALFAIGHWLLGGWGLWLMREFGYIGDCTSRGMDGGGILLTIFLLCTIGGVFGSLFVAGRRVILTAAFIFPFIMVNVILTYLEKQHPSCDVYWNEDRP